MFYHASQTPGIKQLEPRISNHNIPLIYFSQKRENVLLYLSNAVEKYCKEKGFTYDGNWSKWGPYGFEADGTLRIEEYYPKALESTYKGVAGYIYMADNVTDSGFALQIPDAVTSEIPVDVTDVEFVPDAYEAILRAEKDGQIKIVRYKELTPGKKDWIRRTMQQEYEEATDHPEYRFFLEGMFPDVNLPKQIREMVEGKTYESDEVGCSDSQVRIYDEFVLKIEKEKEKLADMVRTMQWLEGKLPAPRVLYTEVKDGIRYLVMSKVKGRMACDPYYMTRPKELLKLLADSLKLLWSVDISDCPRVWDLETELAEARYNVEHNKICMDKMEPTTFGEGGFKDPYDLLNWLETHQPECDPVFSHGDMCLPNVLFENGKVSGFIDLGDAGIGDRWRDIALCYRSLRWNSDGTFGSVYEGVNKDDLFALLDVEPDWDKLRYYILLDELF